MPDTCPVPIGPCDAVLELALHGQLGFGYQKDLVPGFHRDICLFKD